METCTPIFMSSKATLGQQASQQLIVLFSTLLLLLVQIGEHVTDTECFEEPDSDMKCVPHLLPKVMPVVCMFSFCFCLCLSFSCVTLKIRISDFYCNSFLKISHCMI